MIYQKFRLSIVLFLSFGSHFVQGQVTDLARIEYSFIPKSKSEDRYSRFRGILNYPIKIKEATYLITGVEYNSIVLSLKDNYPFDTSKIDRIHVLDLNLGYTFKWNEKWRAGIQFNPRIASTLTQSLSPDDYFINGGIFFINNRKNDRSLEHPYRLVLGLTYNATTGIPFPLPFISYYREINNHWSYNAGIPKANIKYTFNEQSNLQAFVGLDGYMAHVQDPPNLQDQNIEYISLSVVVGGFGYEYCFTKHLVAYMYTGYTFRLNNVLRNKNRDEVYKLNDVNAFYLRTGLKFKL
ncbi:DUF6268 family outer membrane beta-barrel protein [Cognatitamlana onchidii]|uniref:DUF6268 family outer membrane beta-barrel protein n=1 Tax=Cognatitamlana onchidii TaxID=2562860 RepID=UPI001F444335|nr:DUF6268 family outer membrane beta-barrel protein [Algibacter onchidii]